MKQSRHRAKVNVRVDNAVLLGYIEAAGGKAEKALDDISDALVEVARREVAVDTGALRDSIDWYKPEKGTRIIHDGPGADGRLYGVYQEFGGVSRSWTFKPFMKPAAEQVFGRLVSFFEPHFSEV